MLDRDFNKMRKTMRLTQHANKLETNTEVQSQNFGIGDASVVIEILRNRLYEHKIRTLVQEYLCNGRDAQREVKSTKRMVVTIPNELNPVFKVRDFGPGISPDRMANVFVLYGASTKRASNNQTGGFGIGAKSAWSYTDSFTIVSVTDGVKRTYVAHTGVSNQGRLDMISEVETTEPNGAEIQIAVKPHDCREFRESAFRATYFWNANEKPEFKGVTKIDVPEYVQGYEITKNLEIVTNALPNFLGMEWRDKALLVIDGVPYPIQDKILQKITNLNNLTEKIINTCLIKVGNGVVEVSASRESIADSEFTKDNLNKLCLKLADEVTNNIRESFKAVKSNADWLRTYTELSKIMRVDGHAKYGNYAIDRNAIRSELFKKIKLTTVDFNRRRSKIEVRRDHAGLSSTIQIDQMNEIYFLDTEESLVIQNRRLREFFQANPKVYSVIVLSAEEKWTVAPGVGSNRVLNVDLKTSQKAVKQVIQDFNAKPLTSLPWTPITREVKAKIDRTKEMFTVHRVYGSSKSPKTTTLETIKNNNDRYLYINLTDFTKFQPEMSDLVDFIQNNYGFKLCALADQSIKMVQGSDTFKPYQEWVKEFIPTKQVVKLARSIKAKNFREMLLLSKATDKVKDKHILKMMSEYQGVTKDASLPETVLKWVKDEIADFVENDDKLKALFKDKYSLVSIYDSYNAKANDVNELVFYINAKN